MPDSFRAAISAAAAGQVDLREADLATQFGDDQDVPRLVADTLLSVFLQERRGASQRAKPAIRQIGFRNWSYSWSVMVGAPDPFIVWSSFGAGAGAWMAPECRVRR